MEIRITDIDDQVFSDLFCRSCVYWEDPKRFRKVSPDEGAELKAEWFQFVSRSYGCCGKLLYADGEAAAYCQFAPPRTIPGVSQYGRLSSMVDHSGMFVSCLCVTEKHQRQGLGTRLLQAVIADAMSRGVTSVETFARNDSDDNCSGPVQFYLNNGFAAVDTEEFENSSFTLVRLNREE